MAGFAACIKQGALLALNLAFIADDGTPIDMTGAVLASQIRDAFGNLVAIPVIAATNAVLGQFSFTAQSDSTWPITNVRTDLQITQAGVVSFSDTFFVHVDRPVTQPVTSVTNP